MRPYKEGGKVIRVRNRKNRRKVNEEKKMAVYRQLICNLQGMRLLQKLAWWDVLDEWY